MIIFSAQLKVLEVQERSLTKKTGEPFTLVEYVLEGSDKKKTLIVARAMEGVNLFVGGTFDCQIGIGSTKLDTGRIFSNFVVLDAIQKGPAIQDLKPVELTADDELPF